MVIKMEGLSSITGKIIKGAVASRDEVVINPHDQLFLLFTNCTHFVIWVNVNTSGKLSTGTLNDIVSYAKQFSDNVQSVLLE